MLLQSPDFSAQQEALMKKQAATLEEIKTLTNQVHTPTRQYTCFCHPGGCFHRETIGHRNYTVVFVFPFHMKIGVDYTESLSTCNYCTLNSIPGSSRQDADFCSSKKSWPPVVETITFIPWRLTLTLNSIFCHPLRSLP